MSYKVIAEYYKGRGKGRRVIYDNVELTEIMEVIEQARLEHPKWADIFVEHNGSLLLVQDFMEGMYKYHLS